MKVKQLIKQLQAFAPNDEVLFTDGVNGEHGEELKSVTVRRIFDEEAKQGERRVVVLQGFDYGDGMTYEFIDAETDGD